jgi:hypothetical protein
MLLLQVVLMGSWMVVVVDCCSCSLPLGLDREQVALPSVLDLLGMQTLHRRQIPTKEAVAIFHHA